jgi:D-3-phosphoglycerate dehydrogenase
LLITCLHFTHIKKARRHDGPGFSGQKIRFSGSNSSLIEAGALAAALQAGRPGFAAVDAYEEEPTIEHPLFSMRNVVCSPHLGYVEKNTYEIFFGGAFDNVIAFEKGAPTNLINPEVLTTGGRQA